MMEARVAGSSWPRVATGRAGTGAFGPRPGQRGPFGDGLHLRSMEIAYGRQVAVRGFSMSVPSGRSVALLGANGAGKSSVLKAISGLVRPKRGSLWLGAKSLDGLTAHEVASAGVCHIPEGRGVFPSLSVEENLRVSLRGDTAALDEAFERFPVLAERRRQQTGSLSGGEQQMLAVARALRRDYSVLLVDEISLGLAPVIVELLFDFLVELRSQGTAIVIVEQYADQALALADEAYVLRKGELVFRGSAAELRGRDAFLHELYLGEVAAVANGSRTGGGSTE